MSRNRIVHFEIPADEPEALVGFYGAMFGWAVTPSHSPRFDYWFCDTGASEPGINGGIMSRLAPGQRWRNYVDVASIDEMLAKAVALGGTVAMPKVAVGAAGWIAAFVDPQGNECGLWERANP